MCRATAKTTLLRGAMPIPDPHSPRYFAWLYSLPNQRLMLQSLYGIEREVSDSLKPGIDHHVAHARLQWWREECERTANGKPVHPLTRDLVAALAAPPEALAHLTGFVDMAIWDLAGATFETRKELTAYCERWAGAMIEPLVAPATADTRPQATKWRGLGAALREIEMLTELARDAHSGRLRIPLDELDRAGADPPAVAKVPWPDSVAGLLRDRYEQLRGDLARGTTELTAGGGPDAQLACRGLLVWSALARRTTVNAASALPRPLQPARFRAIADNWLAWRVARQATMGRFTLD
jgi:15-cis-phytoene synthase